MSNTEEKPRETVCERRPENLTAPLTEGLRLFDTPNGVIELLDPREVPLGGPRAMLVQRSLPQRARSLVGAWCFLDFYGPDNVADSGGMDVPRHPHTGLATVSWLFEGEIDHIDSAGHSAVVRPGEVNLMNAGHGITHSEFSTAETTILHGAQLWYAFPDRARDTPPGFQSHRPEVLEGEGWTARVFLGSLLGSTSPVRTHLPLTGAELRLEPGAEMVISVPTDHEHGILAVSGSVSVDGVDVPSAHLAVVGTGRTEFTVVAGDEPVIALVIGGEPLGERIVMWWNFIGRSHEEIVEMRADYMREMGFEDAEGNPVDDLRFGPFPADTPAPLPAPELPTVRILPRG